MRSATSATVFPRSTAVRSAQRGRSARFAGIAIASLGPAIFWSVIIQLASQWMDVPLSPVALGAVFATIAVFLFAICAPLMLRKPTAEAVITAAVRGGRNG